MGFEKKSHEVLVGIVIAAVLFCYGAQQVSKSLLHEELATKNQDSVSTLLQDRRIPVLRDSLDFENAKMRYEVLNSRGLVGWLYIFTADGVLMAETPVLGKATHMDTFITPMEEEKRTRASSDDPYTYFTVEMSDMDGTYGANADGVFWFDPDGIYHELPLTSPIVLYSTQRKQYDTPPLLAEFA